MHFFTNDGGGNAMLYLNLIWAWGHPEVYILGAAGIRHLLGSRGYIREKPLFGYKTMVYARARSCGCRYSSGCITSSRWVPART